MQAELAENRNQLDQAEKTYHDLVKARDVSVRPRRTSSSRSKSGMSDMKMKKALAELTEMSSA